MSRSADGAAGPAPRSGRGSARKDAIRQMLASEHRIDVATLAKTFQVTTETVRRDLIMLEDAGLAKRVHGGAIGVADEPQSATVPSLLERARLMTGEKRRIARCALALIPEDGLVILDAGTTVHELAKIIPPDTFASFVSVGLSTAIELVGRGVSSVHTLGGEVNARTLAEGGEWALRSLGELAADTAFIGVSGLTVERGATTTSHADAVIKRAIIASARTRYVLADSSKLVSAYMSKIADLADFDAVVTDSGCDTEIVTAFEKVGVQVVVAT
jgi:DeoR family transcriptional regulator, fructose operon transcriptional repressor